jgi:glycine cleavage system regulatory protein
MQTPLVMTVIGHDRPGLVDLVAGLVAEHGGNWLESRMCRLGGDFAGILRIHVPAEREAALRGALQSLSSHGLTVVIQADRSTPATGAGRWVVLEIVGQDRPGIVSQISHALAGQGVNVEELRTECVSAPMSGETLFKAQAKLNIPDSCNVGELRRHLEKIAGDLLVDLAFEEVPTATHVES